ncbi:probable LRR receptor-like serine/threonine-protein kinase At3g47570 [Magnolia sinica]|uniref:probable LRR receptor-like serine/threonine-protein kinase At3g47570 n=1 Tax=Magnolia sinica TaxID=86752 RepID=UPI002657C7FD|nr:probable LRR receptor-like serine/threonine-protein kinase At3g47570 [Magnolia sinica]
MKLGLLCPRPFWSLLILSFLLPCMNGIGIGSITFGNFTDRLTLIAFQDQISDDPFQVLSSWNDSLHFCNWKGVKCGHRHPERVTALNLSSSRLVGSISPHVANLTFLRSINLSGNSFHGEIPHEISKLFRLRGLDLSDNELQGGIPNNLSDCSKIRTILLDQNKLVGRIPIELSSLSKLISLNLGRNSLIGSIPSLVGNLSSLVSLYLYENALEGSIPDELGWLGKQDSWSPYGQGLKDMNSNLDSISEYLFSMIGFCEGLDYQSFKEYIIILEVLEVSYNNLRGTLPSTIVILSTHLTELGLGGSPISGSIPTDISNLFSLNKLGIFESSVIRTVPVGVGKLQNLEGLYLHSNKLSGQISSSIGNITGLVVVALDGNRLQGSIPSSFGSCRRLHILELHTNELNGTIPKEVLSITTLFGLYIDENSLVGSLPSEVGNLEQLQHFYAGHNKLMGEIPSTLGNCRSLQTLNLSYNLFQGAIPPDLKNLKGINLLDLSHNNLSGHIPVALEKFPFLAYLNLSFNDLDGQVPHQGIFKNASAFSIIGNKRLCGVLCLILLSFFFAILYRVRRKASSKPLNASFLESKFLNISYADLFKATGEFSSDNLIGEGTHGSVYKGILDRDETLVAVKVLNLHQRGASRSFIAECESLRNIRQPNLVKIITACLSIDFEGNDFKALVFEYMPKGSLEKWMHPSVYEQQELRSLNLIQRLDI